MRIGDSNFFNLFARLAAASNSNRDRDEWQVEGVSWSRQRDVHWGPLSYQIERHTLRHATRPRWTLIFVHETWWAEDRSKAFRNAHWAHLQEGDRREVLKWFAEQEKSLDR